MAGLAKALERLTAALDRLGVPYLIGGSLASSIHGLARATMDIDLLADLRPEHADGLAAELGEEFYADAHTMRHAIASGRPFNVIHYATSYKFDLFPAAGDRYATEELARTVHVGTELIEGEPLHLPVASAEDIVLAKLRWYRMGGEASERQWRDVLGVVQAQGSRLDLAYLRRWAAELGLGNLLERALAAGLTPPAAAPPR